MTSTETTTNDNRTFAVGFLRDWAREYPKAAAIIFAGIAAFLAVFLVGTVGVEPEARVQSAFILIAVGVVVLILVDVINDALVMRVLRWTVLILFGFWLAAVALHKTFPKNPALACMTYLWLDCRGIYDQYDESDAAAPATPTATNPPSASSPSSAPGASTTKQPAAVPQEIVLPSAPAGANNVEVVFQFAGFSREDQVKPVMRGLRSAGWSVSGVAGGGERVRSAADKQEVRYGDKTLEPLANKLAEAMNQTKLTRWPFQAKLNPDIKNRLEIWVGPDRPKGK